MDVTEQNLPTVFSQMLQMFPNIPHKIVWLYVNRYSNDIETCTKMLNIQCGKYTDLQSSIVNDFQNINECSKELHLAPLVKPVEIEYNLNNDPNTTEQVTLLKSEDNDLINENIFDNLQPIVQKEHPTSNLQIIDDSIGIPQPVLQQSTPVTCSPSRNLNNHGDFKEPLTLHINVDQEGDSLHSWRPNLSISTLCSDFFMPSPTVENFQFGNNQRSSLVRERNLSEVQMNPEGIQQEPWMCTGNPMEAFYGYLPEGGNMYGVDVSNHLRFQKSQMNAIHYEVIKAKIEMSDLKESIEKLNSELNEKIQSRIVVQDIEKLNEEIVQLRLDCQSLCTEVDSCSKDQVLLGELDERCYKKITPQNFKGSDVPEMNLKCSGNGNYSDDLDESNKWQCPKCTFDNHPAINACEMCHLTRPCLHMPPYLRPSPDVCFCHPKKETPVHS